MFAGLNTEEMLLKDMKAVSGSLNLSVSVLYISLQVSTAHCTTVILISCSDTGLPPGGIRAAEHLTRHAAEYGCVCLCQEFLQREDLEAELSGFCQKYGYDLLLLMTIFFTESKEPIRELAVFSHSTTCREQVHSPPPSLVCCSFCVTAQVSSLLR